jgi:preprotein translocase subunit SecA
MAMTTTDTPKARGLILGEPVMGEASAAQVPSAIWRMLATQRYGQKLPEGLDAIWAKGTAAVQQYVPRRRVVLARATRIVAMEDKFKSLTDAQLREAALQMRDTFRLGRDKAADLDRAYAIVREVSWRTVGMRHHMVQVAAALAIEANCIAELATGEGKTLSATMPATINGWRGRGCHVMTANDYLATRDAKDMAPVFTFCGVSVDAVSQEKENPAERRAAYAADVTYCTSQQVAADVLRDRLALGAARGLTAAIIQKIAQGGNAGVDKVVMRGLACAIIDEADSLLIDEAVTPLIISGGGENAEQVEAFKQAASIAREMQLDAHYRVNHRFREVTFTALGSKLLAKYGEELGGIWTGERRREELVNQALQAKDLHTLGQQYIVDEDKIVIVDEATGRLMPDRTWRDGMHQSVEAKEGVEIQPVKETLARISFQRFFRMYPKLSGMTATAWEARAELWQIYNLPVVRIPTNKPCVRIANADRIFVTEAAKWQAVRKYIRKVHDTGQPLLVGSRSVRVSELLSKLLTEDGIVHQVLNAVHHKEEAEIVAKAGVKGAVTVATNMAGRGTDIKLGEGVAQLGGLHVVGTEKHESGRVDRQLIGRSARQGDPGEAILFCSLEDELMQRYSNPASRMLVARMSNREGEATGKASRRLVNSAQERAQRMALRQRKGVLNSDDWFDQFLGFAGKDG